MIPNIITELLQCLIIQFIQAIQSVRVPVGYAVCFLVLVLTNALAIQLSNGINFYSIMSAMTNKEHMTFQHTGTSSCSGKYSFSVQIRNNEI